MPELINPIDKSERPIKRRRKKKELVERIIEVASREFRENGFENAKTKIIAEKADVTEAQLFRYFSTKQDLFMVSIFKPLEDDVNVMSGNRGESAPKINYVEMLNQFLDKNANNIALLAYQNYYKDEGDHGDIYNGPLRRYFDFGCELLNERPRQDIRMKPEILVRVSFIARLGCVLFKDMVFPPDIADNNEIRRAIDKFIVDGIYPDKNIQV